MLNFNLEFWKEVKKHWINDKNSIDEEKKDEIRENIKSRRAKREKKISAIDFINGDDDEI